MALAREVDAGEVLVQRDADERIGLVIAQADVEARPVLLDERLLGQQRLGLAADDHALDVRDSATMVVVALPTAPRPKCDATRLRIEIALPT